MITQTASFTENPFSTINQSSLEFSRADEADCFEIATLFQQVYGDSSHPEIQPGALCHHLVDKNNYWLACRYAGEIIGTAACIYNNWNQSYELGRAVTTVQWRRQGIAQQMVQRCCDWLMHHHPNTVVVGYPRAQRILEICQQLETPFTACGHDGGVQIANGQYEHHLIIFLQADDLLKSEASITGKQVDQSLPQLVGPQGNQPWRSTMHAANLDWNTAACQDLFIQQVDGEIWSEPNMRRFLASLLRDFGSINSISITVPQMRPDVITAALENHFQVTAWLPGWYFDGINRHNCLRLVRRFGTHQPQKNGMESVIDRFDSFFSSSTQTAVRGVA